MNTMFMTRMTRRFLPVALLVMAASWQVSAQAATTNCAGGTCVFGGSGNDALNNEAARQNKEEWNDTKELRNSVNQRATKSFNKFDKGIDARDKCEASENLNAYWEPNTLRCLDRRSGRPIAP